MSLSTPVAFIIFNRPDTTEKVFQAIRQAQPQKLLVIADGPRSDRLGEAEKCAATRAIINRVDWECEVLTNYSDINLGCKQRVSSGLDWVFAEVEEAIILEDDCLPHPDFFTFCQEMLDRYRHNTQVMNIGGNNFHTHLTTPHSYHFSKYTYIWGWASWRRAWKFYDVTMQTWQEKKHLGKFEPLLSNKYERTHWTKCFNGIVNGEVNTWDYQWTHTCWRQGGLSIVPAKNLVSNIGFGPDATHTTDVEGSRALLPTYSLGEISHPTTLEIYQLADEYDFDFVYGGAQMKKDDQLIARSRRVASKIKRYAQSVLTP
jgi:hypothetical protein